MERLAGYKPTCLDFAMCVWFPALGQQNVLSRACLAPSSTQASKTVVDHEEKRSPDSWNGSVLVYSNKIILSAEHTAGFIESFCSVVDSVPVCDQHFPHQPACIALNKKIFKKKIKTKLKDNNPAISYSRGNIFSWSLFWRGKHIATQSALRSILQKPHQMPASLLFH